MYSLERMDGLYFSSDHVDLALLRDVNVHFALFAGETSTVQKAGDDDHLAFEGFQPVVQRAVLVLGTLHGTSTSTSGKRYRLSCTA